jgi:hypothetical protein
MVNEGSTSHYDYAFTKEDGETPIDTVTLFKYKITDGVIDVLDWTDLNLIEVSGTITIPGELNRILHNRNTRYILFYIIADGEVITFEDSYTITDLKSIKIDTVFPTV